MDTATATPDDDREQETAAAPDKAAESIEARSWFDSLAAFVSPCLPAYGLQLGQDEHGDRQDLVPPGLKADQELALRAALQALGRLADKVAPVSVPEFTLFSRRVGGDS